MTSSREIEAKAAEWLARRDGGGWSTADQAALDAWLQSTHHRVAFLRLETAWRQAHRLNALAAGVRKGVIPAVGEYLTPHFSKPRRSQDTPVSNLSKQWRLLRTRHIGLAIPSTVIIVGVLCYLGLQGWNVPIVYHTEVGGLSAVPLSDGSLITLNSDSGVRVAVTRDERGVTLDKGEAFFEVARDPKRPFVVTVNDRRIVAVGTKFSIRRDDQDIEVTVTEGRVKVESGKEAPGVPAASLSAGSVAHANAAGVIVESKSVSEVEEGLSWRSGLLIFRATPLGAAVAQFNRYNRRQIVIDDADLARIPIGGSFRTRNVDGFIRLLSLSLPIQAFEQDPDRVHLLRR